VTANRRIHIGLLAGILLIAAALRIYKIGEQSFWLDELLSLEASTGRGQTDHALPRGVAIEPARFTKLQGAPPAWKVWTTLEKDSHPPLYYLLLRFWRTILGDGEAIVRMLSAIWSLAAIGLIYLVGKRIAGNWAGLCAAGLLAISPLQVLYAQEARNYAMLCATTLLAAWAYLRAEESDSVARLIGLSAALLLAMLTHYLAAPVLVAIAIYAAMRSRGIKLLRIATAFAVAAIVYAILWGPFLVAQRDSFRRNREGSADNAATASIYRTILRAAYEPARQIGGKSLEGATAAPAIAAVVVFLLIASLIALRKKPAGTFALLWVACPLLFLAMVDVLARDATLTFPRYTVVCGPGVCLLIGQLASGERKKIWGIVALAAAVYAVVSLPMAYRNWKADWRGLSQGLDDKLEPGDVVVLATTRSQTWWLGGAVLGITHYSSNPMQMMLLDREASDDEVKSLSRGWLILHGTDAEPQAILPGMTAIATGSDPRIGRIYRTMSARR
jgi:mannosyltransferase